MLVVARDLDKLQRDTRFRSPPFYSARNGNYILVSSRYLATHFSGEKTRPYLSRADLEIITSPLVCIGKLEFATV